MYSSENASPVEREPEPLPDAAVRSIRADEVGEPHRFLPVLTREPNRDPVGVLVEADQLDPALDPAAEPTEPFGQQVFRDVLRERDEPEGHVRRHGHVQAGHLGAVDEHELAPHRDCPSSTSRSSPRPCRSHISRVRGWIPTALAYGAACGSRSMTRHCTPRRRSSTATVSPTGPAPTTSTVHVLTAVAGERSSGR